MNKLEERFEEIYFEHVMSEAKEDQFKSVKIYAKDAKQLAIEFANYILHNSNWSESYSDKEWYSESLDKDVSTVELFDEFLENYLTK